MLWLACYNGTDNTVAILNTINPNIQVRSGTTIISVYSIWNTADAVLHRNQFQVSSDAITNTITTTTTNAIIITTIIITNDTTTRWEIYCYSEYYAKPKRPWKAQKAGATFILYYFVTVFVLLVLPVLYFMNTTTFSKDCLLQGTPTTVSLVVVIIIIIIIIIR